MGLYDTIHASFPCPRCGTEEERDCQTKALASILNDYHVGDKVVLGYGIASADDMVIQAIAECDRCVIGKYPSGNDRHLFLDVHIRIKDDRIRGIEKVLVDED